MSALRQACARLLSLFRRQALDREFDEEAQSHLDLAMEDYVRRGMPEAEARRLARVKFGAVEASKDAHRDSRGLAWLDAIFYDLRLALRGLRRDRAFTLTAIATLSLALGLNTTVFTVMEAMLFRGLPLARNSDRLVYMQVRRPAGPWSISYADFDTWRDQAQSFEGLAFEAGAFIAFRDGEGRPLDTSMQRVTANTFGLLGVQPILGRDFAPSDEAAGAAPVAILSYRFWETRFGKRRDIVGANVHVNGEPATVVGVMPEAFALVYEQNLWMPFTNPAELGQLGLAGSVLGRLRDGATLEEARAELDTINRRLEAADPATNRSVAPSVVDYSGLVAPDASMIYGSLWAAAWFVLLIACANVANLTLARTIGRCREFSTRVALGASRWRMMRQMFMESLTLAALAGVGGWWITTWSVPAWAAATASRYLVLDYRVDSGTLAYLAATAAAAAVLCSLAPIGKVVQLVVEAISRATSAAPRRLCAANVWEQCWS